MKPDSQKDPNEGPCSLWGMPNQMGLYKHNSRLTQGTGIRGSLLILLEIISFKSAVDLT